MAARKKTEKAAEQEQELSIEESFTRIDERIEILEREDATLEEAFAAYREGMELIRKCDASISRIEERVKEIAEDGSLQDFDE
ncbi:MAG: exodeoxyribonuclease VII small subunit [Lachnospiraceae bacterium]|nr:exodeoxyribonuclease VII small subunit [Lachnospiraceae bacterium]